MNSNIIRNNSCKAGSGSFRVSINFNGGIINTKWRNSRSLCVSFCNGGFNIITCRISPAIRGTNYNIIYRGSITKIIIIVIFTPSISISTFRDKCCSGDGIRINTYVINNISRDDNRFGLIVCSKSWVCRYINITNSRLWIICFGNSNSLIY